MRAALDAAPGDARCDAVRPALAPAATVIVALVGVQLVRVCAADGRAGRCAPPARRRGWRPAYGCRCSWLRSASGRAAYPWRPPRGGASCLACPDRSGSAPSRSPFFRRSARAVEGRATNRVEGSRGVARKPVSPNGDDQAPAAFHPRRSHRRSGPAQSWSTDHPHLSAHRDGRLSNMRSRFRVAALALNPHPRRSAVAGTARPRRSPIPTLALSSQ